MRLFAICTIAFLAASAAGVNRKIVNDIAAGYIDSGRPLVEGNAVLGIATTGNREGRHAGVACSPHIELLASHYGWWFTTRTYGGETVTSTNRVPLSAWAAAHGFSAAEIAEAGIGDVTLSFVAGTIPDDCIPHFATATTLDAHFGRAGGMQGWLINQNPDSDLNASPVTFTADWHHWINATDYQAAAPEAVRAGIRSAAAGRTYHDVHSGDSGHPVLVDIPYSPSGEPLILTSFCTSAAHGPDLTHPTTIRILQAAAASVGDSLKVWVGR